MTTTTTKKAFAWSDSVYATVLEAYKASGKDNSNVALKAIADKVGAKSAQAIRSKLSTSGDYVKVEAAAKPAAKAKVTKIELTRNLESLFGLEKDSLESIAKGNVTEINLITSSVIALIKELNEEEAPTEEAPTDEVPTDEAPTDES